MGFKERLKEAREKKGLTQIELANLLGVSKGAIGNYETGVSSAKSDILFKLFEILEVDPNFLFQDEFQSNQQKTLTPSEQTLLDSFRELNEDGQEKLIDYAEDLVSSNRYKKHSQSTSLSKKQA